MEMSDIYNGSQWAHDIFLVKKARATEDITGRSSNLHKHAKRERIYIRNLLKETVSPGIEDTLLLH